MTPSVSLLVDGDNISGKYAKQIYEAACQHGVPQAMRVYANAQNNSEWHDAPGYRLVHAGAGKNAADVLLAIDAIVLFFVQKIRVFVLVSSDGDFSHLATRLREHGAVVIGVGEKKAPCRLRACCTDFVEIGTSVPTPSSSDDACAFSNFDREIRKVIASNSKSGAGIRITDLAPQMHRLHGTRISTHPERTWRGYLQARPALYDLDARGPQAMVRYRPDGFAGLN